VTGLNLADKRVCSAEGNATNVTALAGLVHLISLDLRNTGVAGDITDLAPLVNLERIDLSGTAVTAHTPAAQIEALLAFKKSMGDPPGLSAILSEVRLSSWGSSSYPEDPVTPPPATPPAPPAHESCPADCGVCPPALVPAACCRGHAGNKDCDSTSGFTRATCTPEHSGGDECTWCERSVPEPEPKPEPEPEPEPPSVPISHMAPCGRGYAVRAYQPQYPIWWGITCNLVGKVPNGDGGLYGGSISEVIFRINFLHRDIFHGEISTLANLVYLERLDLSDTNVTGAVGSLAGLKQLKSVQLQHTDVTGCANFKSQHSSVECHCP
jgi:hypothetical protein